MSLHVIRTVLGSRYYQEIAINRAVQSSLQGKCRVLLTLATGTGKTVVAFQICWKLWNSRWNRTNQHRRPRILYLADQALQERGISFDELAESAKQPDADPFDLLCHIAYNAPLRTRRERAEMLKREKQDFFEEYAPQAREVLAEILEKYIEYGTAQFQIPERLKVPPISRRGSVVECSTTALFGGALKMRTAVQKMQSLLYSP